MSTFSSFSGDGGDTLGFRSRSAVVDKTEVPPIKEEEGMMGVAPVAGAPAVVVGGNRNIPYGSKLLRATRDWSSLPKPATQLILMGLRPAMGDAFSFAAVCKAWQSVFADCKRELFLSLPPLILDCGSSPDAVGRIYSLVEQPFFHREQPIPWQWVRTGGSLSLSDWCVIGVSHGYWIITPSKNSKRRPVYLLDPLFPESHIKLPPVSHFKLGQAMWVDQFNHTLMTAPPTSPDCVIVGTGTHCIWYCRPADTEWVCHELSDDHDDGHDDAVSENWWEVFGLYGVAVLGRQFYAFAPYGKFVVIELLFPRPRVAIMDMEGLPFNYDAVVQLVESDGEILCIADDGGRQALFARCFGREEIPLCVHRYVVLRLDLPARRWVALDTLGKRSIFIRWHSRGTPVTCIGAAEWGGREDCIYFDCIESGTLVVWSMKDASVEHYPLPEKQFYCEWLVPSFCYR